MRHRKHTVRAFVLGAVACSLLLNGGDLILHVAAQAPVPQEYSRVVGGTVAQDIAVLQKAGWVYVVGSATSATYPITSDAYDQTCGTDGNCNVVQGRFGPLPLADVVLTVFDAAGQMRYSTFLGGSGQDDTPRIAVAPDGTVWLAGQTTSTNFEHQTIGCPGAVWIARFEYTLRALQAFQCIAGVTLADLALDAQGNLWVLGTTGISGLPTRNALQPNLAGQLDLFIAQLVPGETTPRLATYIGGRGLDAAGSLAITASGSIAIVGATSSQDFPLVHAVKQTMTDSIVNRDAVVLVLDRSGQFLQFSTYWGGTRDEAAEGVASDVEGNVYVTGHARSPEMPVTEGAIDTRCGSDGACDGSFDAFVAKFSPTGALLASTFYGGRALDLGRRVVIRPGGQVVIVGTSQSPDFPLIDAVASRRWTPGINFEHPFLAVLDDRLQRVTRSAFVLDEQYLPNVALLGASSGFAYVTGQVSPGTGLASGIGTYLRATRLP